MLPLGSSNLLTRVIDRNFHALLLHLAQQHANASNTDGPCTWLRTLLLIRELAVQLVPCQCDPRRLEKINLNLWPLSLVLGTS